VLADVGEPHLIRLGRGELVPDPALVVDHGEQVAVDRRPGLAALGPLAGMGGEHARDRAQTPDPVLRRDDPCVRQLVGQEPVPERGVVLVDLPQLVDDVRVIPVPLRHR
jgi:hypothetical protein